MENKKRQQGRCNANRLQNFSNAIILSNGAFAVVFQIVEKVMFGFLKRNKKPNAPKKITYEVVSDALYHWYLEGLSYQRTKYEVLKLRKAYENCAELVQKMAKEIPLPTFGLINETIARMRMLGQDPWYFMRDIWKVMEQQKQS